MSWNATGLSETDGKQQVADRDVTFNQYGQRKADHRRELPTGAGRVGESPRWTPNR